jgi:hypothetical protein
MRGISISPRNAKHGRYDTDAEPAKDTEQHPLQDTATRFPPHARRVPIARNTAMITSNTAITRYSARLQSTRPTCPQACPSMLPASMVRTTSMRLTSTRERNRPARAGKVTVTTNEASWLVSESLPRGLRIEQANQEFHRRELAPPPRPIIPPSVADSRPPTKAAASLRQREICRCATPYDIHVKQDRPFNLTKCYDL